MAAKINRRVLESYFACKFKAHLKLSSVQDAPSEYLNIAHEEDRRFTRAAQRRLLKTPTDDVVPTRVTLTRSLLSAGSPLILDATFEDERVSLQFDGIMKLDGLSALGSFHYVPILFYDGGTVRQPQKQLLEVYAAVLQVLQDRARADDRRRPRGDSPRILGGR
jgi:hypothetical protein